MTTKLVRENGMYAVYDEIVYETDEPPTLICRFRGSERDCRAYAARLDDYWQKRMASQISPRDGLGGSDPLGVMADDTVRAEAPTVKLVALGGGRSGRDERQGLALPAAACVADLLPEGSTSEELG